MITNWRNEMEHVLGKDILLPTGVYAGSVSDGYHTFDELYEYRKAYNAALFNEWARSGTYPVQRSIHHSDGSLCFDGGWFIVVAQTPFGQISNHYELKDWELFHDVPEVDYPVDYDGHTAQQALERLVDTIHFTG